MKKYWIEIYSFLFLHDVAEVDIYLAIFLVYNSKKGAKAPKVICVQARGLTPPINSCMDDWLHSGATYFSRFFIAVAHKFWRYVQCVCSTMVGLGNLSCFSLPFVSQRPWPTKSFALVFLIGEATLLRRTHISADNHFSSRHKFRFTSSKPINWHTRQPAVIIYHGSSAWLVRWRISSVFFLLLFKMLCVYVHTNAVCAILQSHRFQSSARKGKMWYRVLGLLS